ncbi:hypothetical protein ACFQUU_28150 [Herbaspirillum sp. GCM10030257]|uniref:hypothetical protein n=1 Tax=Herbaspirillum sp. GCM10030257 TaxID=3273393 RepID=UPI0036096B43
MNEAPIQRAHDVIDVEFTPRDASGQVRLQPPLKRRMFLQLQRILRSNVLRLPLSWTGTLLGMAWASPLTAVGLAMALPIIVFRGHGQLVRGHTVALLVRGTLADLLLRRHPFGAMNAMAIGHIVIASSDGLSSRVLIHELAHVRQAARWGPLFPFAYLASSAWAAMRGKDAYWHNRFEIAARRAEKHF